MRLLTSILLETPNSPDSGDIETVDIREFLPPRVISNMTRKDETRFKVVKCVPGNHVDNDVIMRTKIDDMVHWAKQHGFDRAVVESMMTESFNANYERYDDKTIDNESVATGSKANAAVAKVFVDKVPVCKVPGRSNVGDRDDIVVKKFSKHQRDGEREARMPNVTGGGRSKKAMNTQGATRQKITHQERERQWQSEGTKNYHLQKMIQVER